MRKHWLALLILAPTLGGCASAPTGPSVMVLPGPGSSFEQFNADDAACRDWASGRTGTPGQAATASAVGSANVGTAAGAGAGATTGAVAGNPAPGAPASAGSGSSHYAGEQTQWRYDMTYQQCMYAKGHQIPGLGVQGMYRGTMAPPSGSSTGSHSYQSGSIPPPPPGPPPPPPPDAPR